MADTSFTLSVKMASKLVALLLLLSLLVAPSLQVRISLYEDSHQSIHMSDVNVQGCHNLSPTQLLKVSSVNTHGNCFVLYASKYCKGTKVTVGEGGHCSDPSALASCDFNDRTASLRRC